MRTPNGSTLKRPITKLIPIEYFECQLDKNIGENASENVGKNVNENMCDNVVGPKRSAAIAGEIRRRFTND